MEISREGITHLNIDVGSYYTLQSASGSLHFRELPVPREWNPIHRPHVALLLCEDGQVFRFYLSTPCKGENKLCIWESNNLPVDSLIEVKYNDMDFRYYRREENMWAMVGEARNPEFPDFVLYQYGNLKTNGG